ncbi:glycosyl hydrolase family protein [archaeon]|nr:MAG: glycosyl hydrolase family protein [archaeon]
MVHSHHLLTIYSGVDYTNIVSQYSRGRDSIRLESTNTFTKGLFILDLDHMPHGCGSWPAFWTVGSNWPYNGEIDVIENIHESNVNQQTLHTGRETGSTVYIVFCIRHTLYTNTPYIIHYIHRFELQPVRQHFPNDRHLVLHQLRRLPDWQRGLRDCGACEQFWSGVQWTGRGDICNGVDG